MKAGDVTVEDAVARLSRLRERRQPWEQGWRDVTDFVLPRRSFWDLDEDEGKKPVQKIFNSSALFALDLLATGIVGYAISPSVPWFKLRLADFDAQRMPYVGDWLEDCERRMYAEFARSNFYSQSVEYVVDAASIGHATMYVADDVARRRVTFSTRHPKEIFISAGADGLVDTVFREFRPTARDMVALFGEDKVSARTRDMAGRDADKRVRVLHAVLPNAEGKGKPFASLYIDLDERLLLEESGYEELPYAVTRWRTNSDETYGRSPAQDALSDILMINQVTRTRLNLAQLVADPPYNVPNSMRGRERLVPRGYNYYANPQEIAQPVEVGANYPITADVEARIEQVIKNHFHVDFFLMLAQAERAMTAREVVERQGEKAAILGSSLGRINQEFLTPVIERTFAIMMRQGRIAPPPKALIERGGTVDIDFVGPLAQAQKKYHQTAGLLQSLELIGPIAQLDPSALDWIDASQLMREALDAYGMPQKAIREEPEVERIRQARAQAQAQQQALQLQLMQQQQLMQNMDKLNKPMVPGGMLEQLDAKVQQARQGAPA